MNVLDLLRVFETSGENDGFVFVDQDSAVEMQEDSIGEHDLLEVLAFSNEAVDIVLMGDADDILGDDRSAIELRGDVMAGSPDNLDASIVGGVVGPFAGEGG